MKRKVSTLANSRMNLKPPKGEVRIVLLSKYHLDLLTVSRSKTREQSTLVIATVLASASLLLLTVSPDNLKLLSDNKPVLASDDIIIIGLLFGSIGLAYRQITAWSINGETQADKPCCQDDSSSYKCAASTFIREFLLLFFLALPIAVWTWLWLSRFIIIKPIAVPSAILGIIIAIILTVIDWYRRGCFKRSGATRKGTIGYRINKRQGIFFAIATISGVGLALGVANADLFGKAVVGIIPLKILILAFAYVSTAIGIADYIRGKQAFNNKDLEVTLFGLGFGIFVTDWSIRILLLAFQALGIHLLFLK